MPLRQLVISIHELHISRTKYNSRACSQKNPRVLARPHVEEVRAKQPLSYLYNHARRAYPCLCKNRRCFTCPFFRPPVVQGIDMSPKKQKHTICLVSSFIAETGWLPQVVPVDDHSCSPSTRCTFASGPKRSREISRAEQAPSQSEHHARHKNPRVLADIKKGCTSASRLSRSKTIS